jgi:hypothetical protein
MADHLDVVKFGTIDAAMPRIAELDNGASIAFGNRDVQIVHRIQTFANR